MNKKFSFSDCWVRIQESTNISNLSELAELIGVSQPTVSRKKKENAFPRNWAIIVGYESGIHPEWLMTGIGSKQTNSTNAKYQNSMLHEIDIWLSEQIENEPFRKEWFLGTFLDAFPTFAKWKKSQDEKERKDSKIQNKAA